MTSSQIKAVADVLPEPNQYVLAHLTHGNWVDGEDPTGNRYWVVVKFVRGISLEQRERLPDDDPQKYAFRNCDAFGNNVEAYCWEEFGPGHFFGHEVDFWSELPQLGALNEH